MVTRETGITEESLGFEEGVAGCGDGREEEGRRLLLLLPQQLLRPSCTAPTGQEGKIVRGPATAMRREEAGHGRDAVVRMPREKAAAAGRAGAAARTRARSTARREARLGGVGGDGCGSVDLPRGEAAAAPRRRGGLAGVGPGGAASEWMARIGTLIVRDTLGVWASKLRDQLQATRCTPYVTHVHGNYVFGELSR